MIRINLFHFAQFGDEETSSLNGAVVVVVVVVWQLWLAVVELAVDELSQQLDLRVLHEGLEEHSLHLGVVVGAGDTARKPAVS